MRILSFFTKLKSVSKAKLWLIAISVVSLAVTLGVLLNMLKIAIPETKDCEGYKKGVLSEKVKGKLQEDANAPTGMKCAFENKYAALYFNPDNANLALLHKQSGSYWYSNPVDAQNDTIATGAKKGRLNSQIAIDYYDTSGKSGSFNSYEDCVQQKTLDFELIANGIRVSYAMGDKKITRAMLPAVVEKKKFEEKVLAKLDENQQEEILSFYVLGSIAKSDESSAQKYRELYTALGKSEQCYFLDLYTADYKYDDVYEILFEAAGYTSEDVAADNKAAGYNIEVEAFRQITVPVEFTVSDGDLLVNIPASDIVCPNGLYLTKISVLPFFAASTMQDNGYMVLPDGSGAVIEYNNGRTDAVGYNLPIYGTEPALDRNQARFVEPYAALPCFGLVNSGRSAMLGIIEAGESHATLSAQISGVDTSYNQLYPIFEILPKDVMEVHSNSTQIVTNVYQEKVYDGFITVRYKFVDNSGADYSSLANLYREYLIENSILSKHQIQNKMVLSLSGKVLVDDSLFGIPYSAEKTLTSFADAQKIVNEVQKLGVDNIGLGFKAWLGGGIEHNVVNGKMRKASGLGSKGDIKTLENTLGKGNLSFGADLIKTYKGYPQFNSFSYASRRITNNIKQVDRFDAATYMPSDILDPYYLLSSKYIGSVLNYYKASVNALGVNSLWLSDVGGILSSDFRAGDTVDREASKQYIISALEKLNNQDSITLESPNLYALKYCDIAVGIPSCSSGSNLINYDIPFMQMVLSGTMNYTLSPINRNGNTRDNMLRSVETGSDLYFDWIYAQNTVVQAYKGNQAKSLYSMYYGNWIEDAAKFYCRIETELGNIKGESITHHERISDDVYVTHYGDTAVAVNYGNTDVAFQGVIVSARDFKVLGGNS